MAKKRAMGSYRAEAIFSRWLDESVLKYEKLTFTEFKQKCDRGEVSGLGHIDFAGPGTVTEDTTE